MYNALTLLIIEKEYVMTAQKRQPGDMYGIMKIDTKTGEEVDVQIGGWEISAFPYLKQAQEYADFYNEIAQQNNHDARYEARYAGNNKTGKGITHWVI